jgi:putative inorganic carbon (hco3(-)) transporter
MAPLLIAAVPAVLAFILWAILDLERFVLFAVLPATIYPASLAKPAGANVAAVDLLLLLALASWLINNAVQNAPNPLLRGNPLLLPGLLLVAVNWVSLAWSVTPHSTLTFGVQSLELVLIFPLVFASLPRSLLKIKHCLSFLTGATSIMAIALIVSYATSHSARVRGVYLPGLNKNAAGSFQAAGLILAYVLQMQGRTIAKYMLRVALVLNVLGLLATGSRGALLGAAVGILAVAILLKRGKVTAVAIVALLVAAYLTVLAPDIATKTSLTGSYNTTQLRIHLWKDAVTAIQHHPVLGTGARTYWDINYQQPDPNNLFLLTWAEEGLPGMAALLYLLISFGRLLWRARRLPRDAALLAIAAGGVTLSLLGHFQVDVSWARGATTLAFAMMGLVVAIERLAAKKERTPTASRLATPESERVLLHSP